MDFVKKCASLDNFVRTYLDSIAPDQCTHKFKVIGPYTGSYTFCRYAHIMLYYGWQQCSTLSDCACWSGVTFFIYTQLIFFLDTHPKQKAKRDKCKRHLLVYKGSIWRTVLFNLVTDNMCILVFVCVVSHMLC